MPCNSIGAPGGGAGCHMGGDKRRAGETEPCCVSSRSSRRCRLRANSMSCVSRFCLKASLSSSWAALIKQLCQASRSSHCASEGLPARLGMPPVACQSPTRRSAARTKASRSRPVGAPCGGAAANSRRQLSMAPSSNRPGLLPWGCTGPFQLSKIGSTLVRRSVAKRPKQCNCSSAAFATESCSASACSPGAERHAWRPLRQRSTDSITCASNSLLCEGPAQA
mmetsp:Transcript_61112/g.131447  ORF Transcript_61112/g.131447 Transcript_61112/m.131447 type:complete len:223 (-) Transcript_61112:1624-2292(-)